MKIRAAFNIQRNIPLNFQFDIDAQGITAVFGKSGCGKTSLLRALAGLEKHSGAFLKVGEDIWQEDEFFVPAHQRPLAYVFQEASLFPHLNVRGNIEYGLKRMQQDDSKIPLEQIIELMELDLLLDRKTDYLSGGEQQRVGIARALAVNPNILLMDEPLSSLDQARKDELIPYINSLNRELNIPIIYVTHSNEEIARLADQLIFIEDQGIKAAGAMDQLLTHADLSLSHRPQAESIISAVTSTYDEVFHLNQLNSALGPFLVPGDALPQGKPIRLRLAAQDVSLSLNVPKDSSILNILPAVVKNVQDENLAQATVFLDMNGHTVLARITRKSVNRLQLEAGKKVYAQIKSVAVLA
jgi:molybdate transport system ATP-binding protein